MTDNIIGYRLAVVKRTQRAVQTVGYKKKVARNLRINLDASAE